MLEPKYLEGLPDPILKLFDKVEAEILADMARRIVKYDYWIPSADYQNRKLRDVGVLQDEILKALSAVTKKSEAELRKMMQDAGSLSLKADERVYAAAGLEVPSIKDSEPLKAILNAGYKATAQTMRNICRTTARTATKQFEDALDVAWLKVHTGAFDSNTAIRDAIKTLSQSGIHSIRYPSGRADSLEVAVRRAVVTGVNQTSAKLQDELAEELGSDLVEVSAHGGARPDHAVWQGKIYSRSGTHPKYPDFRKATGYGRVDGLAGVNCRHTFGPYFEGSPPVWTDQKLQALNAPNYIYNGRQLNEYEASQVQRYNERQIRKWKREEAAFKAAGLDSSQASSKIKYWQDAQEDFLNQTGLARQYDREQIQTGATANLSLKVEKEMRYARASDTFTIIPPAKGDAIKAQSIYKGLQRSDVGKQVYEAIIDRKIPVLITYEEKENKRLLGRTDGSYVEIFAKNTQTVKQTVSTIIHEVSHILLDTDYPTQWEEAYCFAQEEKHKKGQLTFADLKDIIKRVKRNYPELPWRDRVK